MRHILTTTIVLLLFVNLFAQSNEKIVLEPVGRYLYQSYNDPTAGVDHLLNAIGLSDGRIMVVGRPALTIINVSDMIISGSKDYEIRTNLGGGRDGVVYNDEYIYVNNHQSESTTSSYGFVISHITDTGIELLSTVMETDVFFEKMKIYDDHLYVAAHDKGFRIYSLSNPESPVLVSSLSEGFTDVIDIAKSGDTLYVADGAGGLKIVNISDFNAPEIIAGENTTTAIATSQAIETRSGNVYVAASGGGVLVYANGDLSSRTQYNIGGCAEQLCWVGDYLAVSNFVGVQVFQLGEGGEIEKVGSENTSRFGNRANVRTSFGVGAAGDSLLLVTSWTTTDCFRLVPVTESSVTDINCSAQRIRFPYNGGSSEEYITNAGGVPLVLSDISLSSDDFSTDLTAQTIEVGDTIRFTITYTQGGESDGAEKLIISSNDPDEELLPIQLLGNTTTLDPGEEVPDFTLESFYYNRETGTYEEGSFTLSDNLGKVMWFQVFGTWCPACPSAEVDMQNTIIKEFQDNPDVETYVINQVYDGRDDIEWVKFWTSRWYQRGPMLYDETGEVGSGIFKQLDVGNMPFGRGMIVDQEGKVVKAFFGHQPQMVIETIYSLLENDTSASSINYIHNTDESINVYPNPVSENCTISFGKEYERVKVELYNVEGQKLRSHNLEHTQKANLNFEEMTEGIYFVYIYLDNTKSIKKIIKY